MRTGLLLVTSLLVTLAASARADEGYVPPALKTVNIEEHLGAKIPMELPFIDQNGKPVVLGDYFKDGKPVVLSLVYFKCPMLCSLILAGEAKVMREMSLDLGTDYHALTVSFDPADKPADALVKQSNYLQAMGNVDAKAGWTFLTGQPDAINALTKSIGFDYYYDEQTKQFAHAAAIFILTPDGKVSRYLYDVSFKPKQLKLALVEASAGTIGNTLDHVILRCYHYDPASRRYGFAIFEFLRTGGAIVLISLTALIAWLIIAERKKKGMSAS